MGTLDIAPDLQLSLRSIREILRPDGLLIGAMSGGDSLPALRNAMLAADRACGRGAAPHIHPRIDAPTLATLLSHSGFDMPVVDIDRVEVRYRSLGGLVRDLRRMAATNILAERPRLPLGRKALAAAGQAFAAIGDGERTTERFEILHFAG